MNKIKLIVIAGLLVFAISAKAADRMEGGYVGSGGQIAVDVVWNFIHHFSYEQYYWSQDFQFTSYNNHRVDAMDFAFYCGHGNQWYLTMSSGPDVDLSTAGNTADKGYGDWNCEFLAMESCDVIPSPIELTDWYTNWRHTGGIFDGIHQVCGYHTVAYFATCRQICDYYGGLIHAGYGVWQSWFDAINHESALDEMGAAVMDVNCQNDTHETFAPDPPENDQNIIEWYQY
jgi:Family of unknown function (DUF6345)